MFPESPGNSVFPQLSGTPVSQSHPEIRVPQSHAGLSGVPHCRFAESPWTPSSRSHPELRVPGVSRNSGLGHPEFHVTLGTQTRHNRAWSSGFPWVTQGSRIYKSEFYLYNILYIKLPRIYYLPFVIRYHNFHALTIAHANHSKY